MTLLLAVLLFAAATPAIQAQAGPHVHVAGPVQKQSLVYGPEQRQYLDLFTKAKAGRAPLIVYLHGGGWSAGSPKAGTGGAQPEFYTSRGFAYAGVGYRYVPGVTVEQQLADVARAVAYLRSRPEVDGQRIVLVGHSSGGHLAALLGTDPSYLASAGVPFEALKGVVLLDSAAIDIAPFMAIPGGTVDRYYRPAFGNDPARWSTLSPLKQTEAPNAPAWAVLYDTNNPIAGLQGGDLVAGLLAAGARDAAATPISGTTHMRLNDAIGTPGDMASGLIADFLARTVLETQRPRLR
jgi:acetyl esterase/lipase